jgi:hypothetical protein
MRKFIGVLVIGLGALGILGLVNYYKDVESQTQQQSAAGYNETPVQEEEGEEGTPRSTGLPKNLEPSLEAAMKQGPAAVDAWLKKYRRYLKDPKLAEIELDYVVMLARQDPVAARDLFRSVQRRVKPASPMYERVKRLEKTFE